MPTVPPTPTTAAVPPTVLAPIDEINGLEVLYREFTETRDSLWRASAGDPSARTRIADFDHPVGLGIVASLSPDGRMLAYNIVPLGTADRLRKAVLWLLDLSTGEARQLAQGVELAATPHWAPDGSFVVIRRFAPAYEELIAVDVTSGDVTVLADSRGFISLIGIGVAPDGTVYYFTSTDAGDDLWFVSASGGNPVRLLHASDGPTRNWQLSPNGQRIAYLARLSNVDPEIQRTFVADLPAASVSLLIEEDPLLGIHVRPIWTPDSSGVTLGRVPAAGQVGAAMTVNLEDRSVREIGPPASGYDVPILWSPDVAYIAVQTFREAGSLIGIVAPDGRHLELGNSISVDVIGWLSD